jgi:hypothetical protein
VEVAREHSVGRDEDSRDDMGWKGGLEKDRDRSRSIGLPACDSSISHMADIPHFDHHNTEISQYMAWNRRSIKNEEDVQYGYPQPMHCATSP